MAATFAGSQSTFTYHRGAARQAVRQELQQLLVRGVLRGQYAGYVSDEMTRHERSVHRASRCDASALRREAVQPEDTLKRVKVIA